MFGKTPETVYRLTAAGLTEKSNLLVGFETDAWPSDVAAYRGKVDAVIVSIKKEEFEAVHRRFQVDKTVSGRREWNMCRVTSGVSNRTFRVALVKANTQGNGESQNVTRDAIEDLEPGCILVVGIAGAVPGDLTLGDVVFGNHVHDLTVSEVKSDGRRAFSVKGLPIAAGAQHVLSNLSITLPTHLLELGLPDRPPVRFDAKIQGDSETQTKVRDALRRRFGSNESRSSQASPSYVDGEVASSDTLVKFVELVGDWKKVAKAILCVEMESAGACRAGRTRAREYPVIPIRAMSDVIGLERDEQWTFYACEVAAAFTLAFIKSWERVPA